MAEAKIKTEPEDPPVIKVEDLVSDSEDSDSVASQPIPKKQKIETITSANELGEGSSTSGISVKTEIKEEPEDNSEYSMEFDETGAVKDEPNTSDEEDDDDFDEDEDQDVEDIEELKFEAEDESLLDKGYVYTSNARFQCEECDYSGTWKQSLKHAKTSEKCKRSMDNSPEDTKKNAITYYCVHCKFSTSSFYKFHAHNLSCENLTFKCSFCELICFSQNNFDIHVYRRHKRQNDVEKRYFFKNELFSCEKCDHVGVKSDTRHECDPKKVQIKQQKKHHCGYCNFSCKKAFNLSRHCETLHKVKNYSAEMVELINQSKSNHQCPYCESFCSDTTLNLQNHVLNEHWEQNDVEKKIKFNFLKCQNCLFRTLQKKLLVEHILRCHKETSKLLQSPVAPKPDTKLKEPKRRQYRCTQCPYKTRSLLNVVKHQKVCKEVDAQPVAKDLDGLFKVKRVKP